MDVGEIAMTFCELREKDVINIRDCRRLGHVCDLELDPKNGCILARKFDS